MANFSGICELLTQHFSDRTYGSKLIFKKYKSNTKTPLRANAVIIKPSVNCTSELSEQKTWEAKKPGLTLASE